MNLGNCTNSLTHWLIDSWPHKYWRLSLENRKGISTGRYQITKPILKFYGQKCSFHPREWVKKNLANRYVRNPENWIFHKVTDASYELCLKPRKELCSTHWNLIYLFLFPHITWHFHTHEHRSEAYFSNISLGRDVDSNKVENTTKQCMPHKWSRHVHYMK